MQSKSNYKKRIAFVINVDWYFNLHWVDRVLAAQSNGYEVHVVCNFTDGKIYELLNGYGFNLHHIPLSRTSLNPLGEIYTFMKLYRILKSLEPSVVHSITIKPNLYSSILCNILSIKLISTYPGLGTLKTSESLVHKFVSKLILFTIKGSLVKSSILLFENEEDRQYFLDNKVACHKRLIRVNGAGIDIDKFYKAPINTERDGLQLLFASRLLSNKGLSDIVMAVDNLKRQGYQINLSVAGIFDLKSPYAISRKLISEYASKGLIEWLGQRDDIPNLIGESDIVVLPTTYGEGVPRILIEACAMGRPILTTPLGGCKDICKHRINGMLVEPRNVSSIVDALKEYYSDKVLLQYHGDNGRKLVLNGFTNKTIISQTLGFYEQLMDLESCYD